MLHRICSKNVGCRKIQGGYDIFDLRFCTKYESVHERASIYSVEALG